MSFSVDCPECRTPLEVADEHRNWKVRCPQCRHEFRPVDAAAAPDLLEVVADEEVEDEPRRRRRRRYENDAADPEAGAREIAKPAFALEVTGWIYVLIALAVCVGLILFGLALEDQPKPPQRANAPNDDPPELFIFLGCCLGVLSAPYFAAIAYGARKARRLSSQGWGTAAAIMAAASIVLFGIFSFP